MSKTNLRNRVRALERAARGTEPCSFQQHRDLLLEILQRRAVPLPPLEGVDLPATADFWAGDAAYKCRSFVMLAGEFATAEQLMARYRHP